MSREERRYSTRNQRTNNRYNSQFYVEGNAVRKVQELPERSPRTYVDGRRVNISLREYKEQEKALRIKLPYMILFTLCVIAVCVQVGRYLSLKESITEQKTNIAKSELNVKNLKDENDILSYNINKTKDAEEIIRVATTELGMIQAGRDQISFYDQTESEYMKQYCDVN